MRFALCLRSISYLENYTKWGSLQPYTIDFRDTAPSIKECIIEDLQSQGHQVDVFLSTYHHPHTTALLETFQPVQWHFYPFNNDHHCGTRNSILFHLDAIQQILEYETAHPIYDVVLFSRFDLWFFEKLSDYELDYTSFIVPFFSEDSFFSVPRERLLVFRDILQQLLRENTLMHEITAILKHRGEKLTLMYGDKPVAPDHDYPLYRFGRLVMGPHQLYDVSKIKEHPTRCPCLIQKKI